MKFTHQRKMITLLGVRTEPIKGSAIGAHKLKGLIRRKAITHCVQMLPEHPSCPNEQQDLGVFAVSDLTTIDTTPENTELLQKYSHLFSEPSSLPPARTVTTISHSFQEPNQ